jgi:ABC-type transport system involved in multi-copper enzyme maturation permease subunit
MHFVAVGVEDFPLTYLVGLVIASLAGTLSSVMLSTTITSEHNRHVYDLFLIRPVKRRNIILSKYLSVYLLLIIAAILCISIGLIIDTFNTGIPNELTLQNTFESLILSISSMSVACSLGILIGNLVNSVPVAAILSIYLGNQLSSLIMLPSIFIEGLDPIALSLSIGISVTTVVLLVSIRQFNKKQV